MARIVVVEALRDFLIANGIAEAPVVKRSRAGAVELGNDGTLPVVVLDPRSGPWSPSGAVTAVVTIRSRGLIPQPVRERFVERSLVDTVVVATSSPRLELVQRDLRIALDDQRGYLAGTLRIEESLLYTSPLPVRTPDEATFGSVQTFAVACRVRLLEGFADP